MRETMLEAMATGAKLRGFAGVEEGTSRDSTYRCKYRDICRFYSRLGPDDQATMCGNRGFKPNSQDRCEAYLGHHLEENKYDPDSLIPFSFKSSMNGKSAD